LSIALLFTFEAVYLGLFSSDEFISNYHFGSEAMSFHGGWAYRSAQTYVGSLAVLAALVWIATVAFSAAAVRRSMKALLTGCGLWVLVLLFTVWARKGGG